MDADALVVFIVDDDASSRCVATFPFKGGVDRVFEFGSGEACLAALDLQPDIILLDVEMPGLDGITVCRRLREAGCARTQVIFVSIHNDLETRLRSYDAGGNDYIVKPVLPEELAPKVAVARQLLAQQRGLEAQALQASQVAFAAMSSMGELGIVLQFLRNSFASASSRELSAALVDALRQFGLEGLLAAGRGAQRVCLSTQGACSQLELSILDHAAGLDRLFQFHDRLVVNYPNLCLVVSRLPIADDDHVGRLRDNLAILAEGADARLAAIAGDAVRSAQHRGIDRAVAGLSAVLESVEQQQQEHRLNVLYAMDQYILDLERSFVHLGLTEAQELALSTAARATAAHIGQLLGDGRGVADQLHTVTMGLRQLGGPA
jgi:CheY-like chemotaxis protein